MQLRPTFILILLAFSCTVAIGQTASPVTLTDFTGSWSVDLEKSFTRVEREKLTDYRVIVTEADGELTVDSLFTLDGIASSIREVFLIDKNEHRYVRNEKPIQKNPFYDHGHFINIRAYRGSMKDGRVKIAFQQPLADWASVYLDQRLFELSADKKTLTIETTLRSARPGDAARNQKKRLILVREP